MKKEQTLSSWLVESILEDEAPKIKKIVVIYPGRFQPMGKHHAEIYKWLQQKFSGADVYIATTNKVELPKSPFDFADKKKIIKGYGINNVVQVKNPYIAEEILKKYNPETTAAIFVVGTKDMDEDPRFTIGTKKSGGKTYFQSYVANKDNMAGYTQHGYLLTAPHVSLNVPGYGEMSGTQIRKALGDKSIDDSKRRELFKSIFGFNSKSIYDLVTKKLLSLNEIMENFVISTDYANNINNIAISKTIHESTTSAAQLGNIVDIGPSMYDNTNERYKNRGQKEANRLGWEVVDYLIGNNTIAQGLVVQQNSSRVSFHPISSADHFGDNIEMNNISSEIESNPAYIKWKNFIQHIATSSGMLLSKFVVESYEKNNNGMSEQSNKLIAEFLNKPHKKILSEGGAYGHMSHPFDDNNLTFGDFKNIIRNALQGTAEFKNVVEKTDGQNIMVTWKDNKLKAARNGGQIKNPISVSEIATMFDGRGDIKDAFVFAMMDLDAAISKLSNKDRNRIFDNGKNFMNLEILYPATKNVVDYDRAVLQFHGALVYDSNGQAVGEVKNSGSLLASMINKVNQSVQSHFNIIPPQILTIKKGLNFAENQAKFLAQLNKLQSTFNLKDSDTIGMYHQSWWSDFISKKADSMKYAITNDVLVGLVNRWAFFEKAFDVSTMKKTITNPEFLEWVLKFDKQDHKSQYKSNITPFENIMLGVGAEVMKNAEGFLSASPDKAVQDIRKQLVSTIKSIRNSGDLSALEKMETQLKRIEAIGGFKQIVPSEGLVFKYKGNTYKFSGVFAPINNLLGLTKYSR